MLVTIIKLVYIGPHGIGGHLWVSKSSRYVPIQSSTMTAFHTPTAMSISFPA